MNPIHFVRLFLDDTQDDPIEFIIKVCHLFGPYTYKGLATLYAQEYRLPTILEISESPVIHTEPEIIDISEATINDVSDTVSVITDISESESVINDVSNSEQLILDISESTITDAKQSILDINKSAPVVVCSVISHVVLPATNPVVVPTPSSCGCFPWFRRPK